MRFQKGLFQDTDPQQQPEGTYRDAKNLEFNRQRTSLISEQGTALADNIPANQRVIGSLVLNDDRIVLWTARITPSHADYNDCSIYIYDPDTGVAAAHTDGTRYFGSGLPDPPYAAVDNGSGTSYSNLNFRPDKPVQATFRVNGEGETELYWTDGYNPPRYLNLDEDLPESDEIVNNSFNLFTPVDSVPVFNLVDVKEGHGNLLTGTYQFAFAYVTRNDFSQTNWLYTTNPVSVLSSMDGSIPYVGDPIDTETGVGISFTVGNLDRSYYAVRIAVIKDGVDVSLLPDLPIVDTPDGQIHYVFSGNESLRPGSLEDIAVDNLTFKTAATLAQVDGNLYLGNVQKRLDIGYQPYANNIKVEARPIREPVDWSDRLVASPDNPAGRLALEFYKYSEPYFAYRGKSYKRGEVYALYISFILRDGTETKAYHIPGREADANNGEKDSEILVDAGDGLYDKVGPHYDFHLNSRMTQGTPGVPDPDSLGYWENQNEFYGQSEEWNIYDVVAGVGSPAGDIKGLNVRHHRMPENGEQVSTNHAEGKDGFYWSGSSNDWSDADLATNPLYLRFYDIKFPDEITSLETGETYKKEDVVAYKIYHAKKDVGNQLILDSASVMNAAFSSTASPTTRHLQEDTVWNGQEVLIPHGVPPNFEVLAATPGPKTVLDPWMFYARPGHSLYDRLPVGAVTFAKHVANYSDRAESTPYSSIYGGGDHSLPFNSLVYEDVGVNYPLEAIAYAEKNLEHISLKEKGFDYDMNNRYGETKVVMQVTEPGNTDLYGPPGSRTDNYAEGGVTIDPTATNGSITALTVNGVSVITGTVLFNGTPEQTARDLRDNINATTSAPNYTAYVEDGVLVVIRAATIGSGPNGFVVTGTDTGDVNMTFDNMANGGADTNPDSMRKMQWDLCQFKKNVHLRFQDQPLVFTGYLNTSLDEDTGWADPVPGDMFLCTYYYNAISLWDIFTVDNGIDNDDTSPTGHADGTENGIYKVMCRDWPDWAETKPYIDESLYKEFQTNRLSGEVREDDQSIWDESPQNSIQNRPLPWGYPHFEAVETRVNLNYRHKGTTSFEDWTNGLRNLGRGETNGYPLYKNVSCPDITRFEADISDDVRDLDLSLALEEYDATDFLGVDPDRIRNDKVLAAARSGALWKWPSQFWSQWMGWHDWADNYVYINSAYNGLNEQKVTIPWDSNRPETSDFSTRVVRSQPVDADDAVGTWRTYRPNDVFDFSREKGRIVRLGRFQDDLLVHFEKTLVRMGARHELNVDGTRTYIGAGDIFNTAPRDILDVTGGYGGLQDLLGACSTPFGYAFVDRRKSKAFLYDGNLNEISLNGLRNYFIDNVNSETGEVLLGFSDDHNRLMITHLTGDQTLGNDFTVSYLPELKVWESFHSYLPDNYVVGSHLFFSCKNDGIYEHGRARVGEYYGANYACTLQVVDNEHPALEKQVSGLNLDTKMIDEFGVEVRWTFDKFRIWNHQQDTGWVKTAANNDEVLLDKFGQPEVSAGARETLGRWRINQFRDLSYLSGSSQMPTWIQKRRLSGQYHLIDLSFTNIGQRELTVHNVWLDYRRSLR
jgi:hypothetical protein